MKLSVSPPIDKLLNGGIEAGCITNFYGPPGTGKSQIAMMAALACIADGKKAVYVDTEGGFSLERMEQLSDDMKKLSERIILLEPTTWDEQKDAIRKVDAICKKESVGLIIVDSMVALWRLTINDDDHGEVNKELATQLSMLSRLARAKNIPVLLTNQVYEDIESGKTELSSKNIVKWWSKNLVELVHTGRAGCRLARVAKARALPEDKSVEFQICDKGLKEASKWNPF